MHNRFVNEVRRLKSKGQNLRQLHNMYQGVGLGGSLIGLGALIASPWVSVPFAISLTVYGASVLSERKRTGRLALLPWSSDDISATADNAIGSGAIAQLPVRDTHYLSLEEKALYYLVNDQGPRLSVLAEHMEADQFEYVVSRLTERLMMHEGFLNNPHAIESALVSAGEIGPDHYFQDALSYLPEDAKRLLPSGMYQGVQAIAPTAQAVPVTPSVGNATRLGAVDVAATAVATMPAEPARDELAAETITALKQFVRAPKNLLMVATGGGGKGITLANLCRFRHEANSNFVAVWCDPKNDPDESGYFNHDCIHAFRFSAAKLPPEMVVQKLRDMLNYHRDLCAKLPAKTPVWLVLDEWYAVMTLLKAHNPELLEELKNLIRSTISLLDAEHKHIVLVGQSPKLDDVLPGEGGLMANMNSLCLFKKGNVKMLEKAGQCGIIPRSVATAQRLSSAVAISPRDRAMYFGDRLWPSPELVNYGNYDRDKQSHLGKASVQLQQPELHPRAQVEEYSPSDVVPTEDTVTLLNRAYDATADQHPTEVHPKVQRFAEVVREWFAANPGKQSVGLGKIINDNTKLSALRKQGKKEAIEKLMHLAADAGLIVVSASNGGFTISLTGTPSADDLDLDF